MPLEGVRQQRIGREHPKGAILGEGRAPGGHEVQKEPTAAWGVCRCNSWSSSSWL